MNDEAPGATMEAILLRAQTAARNYAKATGVDCFVIDAKGGAIGADTDSPSGAADGPGGVTRAVSAGCSACRRLRALSDEEIGTLPCAPLHLHAAMEAERFGGSFVYLCAIGMMHWASPLNADGGLVGVMVGGPVMSIDRPDAESALRDYAGSGAAAAAVDACLDEIPVIAADRARSLADMLRRTAENVSKAAIAFEDGLLRSEQQSRISEQIHDIKRRTAAGENIPAYPVAKERELLTAIRRGDENASRRVLNELLGAVLFTSGRRLEIVKFRCLELLVLLSRAAMEAGAGVDEVLGINYRYLRRLQDLESVDELAFMLDAVLRRFVRLAFPLRDIKHSAALRRALGLIRERYAGGITLSEAAAAAELSPAYFSKVFKEEIGENFSDYVNRLRVRKAAELLVGTKESLAAVSGEVGYDDQSYFNRVFKRFFGVSPGRFRESGGRRPPEVEDILDDSTTGKQEY